MSYSVDVSIIILTIFAYFLGSISSAILISQISRSPDPRSYGSKNPGATNILRKLGIKIATTVIIFDVLKGAIPVLIGLHILDASPKEIGIITLAGYLGHTYPIFFHFQGGKGVATSFGALSSISTDISVIMIITWISTTLISGYASLGTILASLITPCYIWWIHPKFTILTITLTLLILIRHRGNIARLYKNQEYKIWKQKNNLKNTKK